MVLPRILTSQCQINEICPDQLDIWVKEFVKDKNTLSTINSIQLSFFDSFVKSFIQAKLYIIINGKSYEFILFESKAIGFKTYTDYASFKGIDVRGRYGSVKKNIEISI